MLRVDRIPDPIMTEIRALVREWNNWNGATYYYDSLECKREYIVWLVKTSGGFDALAALAGLVNVPKKELYKIARSINETEMMVRHNTYRRINLANADAVPLIPERI